MENATVMDFHDSPDVCLELGYQLRHTIMRLGSQDGSDFRPRLRQDFFNACVHDQHIIYQEPEQLKRVSFPEGRVNDDHMLLGRVEGNSVYTASFMDACATQIYMTMAVFIAVLLSIF